DPSVYSTMECTTLCGWITTLMREAGMENSQCASMTSSPLFSIVAESTEIFFPIDQFGCLHACSGVTCASASSATVRNGPPDAVRINFSTPTCADLGGRALSERCGRHW